jgi:hypothetical protein
MCFSYEPICSKRRLKTYHKLSETAGFEAIEIYAAMDFFCINSTPLFAILGQTAARRIGAWNRLRFLTVGPRLWLVVKKT